MDMCDLEERRGHWIAVQACHTLVSCTLMSTRSSMGYEVCAHVPIRSFPPFNCNREHTRSRHIQRRAKKGAFAVCLQL